MSLLSSGTSNFPCSFCHLLLLSFTLLLLLLSPLLLLLHCLFRLVFLVLLKSTGVGGSGRRLLWLFDTFDNLFLANTACLHVNYQLIILLTCRHTNHHLISCLEEIKHRSDCNFVVFCHEGLFLVVLLEPVRKHVGRKHEDDF